MKRITYILGAGSNCKMGFPLGKELYMNTYKEILNDPKSILNQILELFVLEMEIEQYPIEFAKMLKLSNLESVDEFAYHNPQYELFAKIAISYFILKAEGKPDFDIFDFPEENWYRLIWKNIYNSEFLDFPNKNYGFITFNYDRSLENYLYTTIFNTYNTRHKFNSKRSRTNVMKKIPIYHVYGKLGNLPFEKESKYLEYGLYKELILKYQNKIPTLVKKLFNIIKQSIDTIKLIYDERTLAGELKEIHELISNSSKLVFLGFAYNSLNMTILGLDKTNLDYPRDKFGYCHDFEKNNKNLISQLTAILKNYGIGFNENRYNNIKGISKNLIKI